MRRALLGGALAILACGCGGRGAVYLTLEAVSAQTGAPLRIPDQADDLTIAITSADGTSLLSKDYSLSAPQTFPLTLGLDPGAKTGDRIHISATASLGGSAIGDAQADVEIPASEITDATVRIVGP